MDCQGRRGRPVGVGGEREARELWTDKLQPAVGEGSSTRLGGSAGEDPGAKNEARIPGFYPFDTNSVPLLNL
jgi:hypothetical protein